MFSFVAILVYLAASKTINFLLYGIEEYTAIVIISEQHEAIRQRITQDLHRSLTVYQGRGGHSDRSHDILYCVLTKLEVGQVRQAAREIDPNAFILIHPLSDVEGGHVRKPRLH